MFRKVHKSDSIHLILTRNRHKFLLEIYFLNYCIVAVLLHEQLASFLLNFIKDLHLFLVRKPVHFVNKHLELDRLVYQVTSLNRCDQARNGIVILILVL
jgi:hypothetical protein